jgi:hypothetical protein
MLALGLLTVSLALSAPPKVPDLIVEPPKLGAGSTIVQVALWLVDIDSIDSAAQSFVANVFIKLSWQDERLAHKGHTPQTIKLVDIWSPGVLIINEIGRVRKTLPEVVKVQNDGTVIYYQRYVGSFSQPLHLRDFPFDEQLFRLHLVRSTKINRDVQFVQDEKSIALGFPYAVGISEDISLPDWTIESYTAGPLPYKLSDEIQASGYAFDFIAKRDSKYYVYKVIMPLILIVMMSWAVFWINPKEAGIQISISTASMLTLIAYRFTVDLLVPRVSYLTRLDMFILGSTFLVFFALIQALVTSSLMRSGNEIMSLKIDYLCRFLFPVLFAFVLVISFGARA